MRPTGAAMRGEFRAPWDDARKGRLIRAYMSADQPTLTDLGKRFNCSSEVLRSILDEAGIPIRRRQGHHRA